MPVVWIPPLLRTLTAGRDSVPATGATLADVIADLDRQHPGVRDRLCDGPRVRPGLAVMIDDAIVRGGLDEPIGGAKEVHFVQAIGGG